MALLDTQVTGVRHAAWKQHCASHTILCAAALRQAAKSQQDAMTSSDGGDGLAVDRQGHSDGVDGSEEQPRREGKGGKKHRASRAVDCKPEVRLELLLHRLLVCTMSGCCVGTIPFGNVPPMLQCRVDGELKETSDGQRRKAVKADKRKKTAGNVAEVRPPWMVMSHPPSPPSSFESAVRGTACDMLPQVWLEVIVACGNFCHKSVAS